MPEDSSILPYKILSLDGGGTWAILQAMTLAELYGGDVPGRRILSNFNLVVANSGGSIVAAALWADMTPNQIVKEFSRDEVIRNIFTKLPFFRGLPRSLFPRFTLGPKYLAAKKLDAIEHLIAKYAPALANTPIQALERVFGEHPTDLLLLAYDYDTNRAKFLRTNPDSKAGGQLERVKEIAEHKRKGMSLEPKYKTTLAEAVHASTNAPVNYFDAPASISYNAEDIRAWDGAIAGYNNPILAGITEALANGVDRKTIRILSLGTGSVVLPQLGGRFTAAYPWLMAMPYKKGFWITGDLLKVSQSILENPPDVATYVAYFMIDDQRDLDGVPDHDPRRSDTRIVRLNPLIQPIVYPGTETFDIPSAHSDHPDRLTADEFKRLMTMDLDAVTQEEIRLIKRFGQLWLDEWVHNQPILAGSTRIECEIGQRWYSQGRRQARKLGLAPDRPSHHCEQEKERVRAKVRLEDQIRSSRKTSRRRDESQPLIVAN